MSQRAELLEYRLYFTEDRKDVSFAIGELSETWTEQTLRERFAGLPIHCQPNPGAGLGDLACAVDVKSYNGLPALFISFFFEAGQLQQVSVNVPWWKHDAAYARLRQWLGPPHASQVFPHSGVRLHGWQLAGGAGVFFNRDASLNPLEWSAIQWRSASSCAALPCFGS